MQIALMLKNEYYKPGNTENAKNLKILNTKNKLEQNNLQFLYKKKRIQTRITQIYLYAI